MSERALVLAPVRRTVDHAEEFAHEAHFGQVDKAGKPYTEHLLRVVQRVSETAEEIYGYGTAQWDEAC